MKGILIVIAGIDGSGKSTIAEKLTDLFFSKGILNAKYEKFIYDNKYDKESLYETVRYICLEKKEYSKAEFEHIRSCFFLKKRIRDIFKRTEQGEIIILDRFVETIIGHQHIYDFDKNIAMDICDFNSYRASYYFMLKVEPEVAYKRIQEREKDIQFHEQLKNLKELDYIYTNYALNHEGIIINGTYTIEDILTKIYGEIENYISERDGS